MWNRRLKPAQPSTFRGRAAIDANVGPNLARIAARQPMLDREEEQRLARESGAGDTDAARRLVSSHLRFVIRIARHYRNSGLPMSDLVQEGTVGLIQAVRRFNPDRGVRLSTYAMWWIRAAIQDHVVRSWSIVRVGTTTTQKALVLRLRRMTAELVNGAEGLSDEIVARLAASFGTTASEVLALARRISGADESLDRPIADDDDGRVRPPLGECMASDTPTPEEALAEKGEWRLVRETIAKAFALLPPREQFIIRKRYFEDVRQTFDAIGVEIGLSKDRVRQLEAAALAKLREVLSPALAGRNP
ncbi:MAG: RNA polymerase factor sigma-32 [Rhodospirillales bacterium]|jgi:RNA polymerase sigma-32 factor|nr:RNA polymerase factor sigma-32 [Rhodospirillales bacterium]MDP6805447.1 RNA polymerase factor sigma-32 [Rhodospirillales bacterium]